MASRLAVGVDVGGTKVQVALVDPQGTVLATSRFPSGPQLSYQDFLAETVARIREFVSKARQRHIRAVGAGCAGQSDPATGEVDAYPNLSWGRVPLRGDLERALGLPVLLTNDVRAATFGEWQIGAGRGLSDLVCLFVGTGVGGGVVTGGRLLVGAGGSGGELGHITVDLDGPPCRCRNRGCLEAYVGGWAIALHAQQAVRADPAAGTAMLALVNGDAARITAATVSEAAHMRDGMARRLVSEIGAALGAGVASAVNALNPRMVVLGGGVVEGMPELVEMVGEAVKGRALPAATVSLEVTRAELGADATVVGAAIMAGRLLVKRK